MAHMNVFDSDHFGMVNMTDLVSCIPYRPRRIGEMDLFDDRPIQTQEFSIEQVNSELRIIQTSLRGDPVKKKPNKRNRDIRQFETTRLACGDKLTAGDVDCIRAVGTESELEAVEDELLRRIGDDGSETGATEGLLPDLELTREWHRLGAVQGLVLDADATTVLYDWYDHFEITQDPYFEFDWSAAGADEGVIRRIANRICRQMWRNSGGNINTGVTIHAICGDNFWDDLTQNPEVRNAHLQQGTLQTLSDGFKPWVDSLFYGGIIWENYRGSNDGSTIAIPSDECRIFPRGAGIFKRVISPAEFLDFVNRPGLPEYLMILPDEKRNAYVEIELYAYMTYMCTKPGMLQRGRKQP